jgi:DNA repair protein RadC
LVEGVLRSLVGDAAAGLAADLIEEHHSAAAVIRLLSEALRPALRRELDRAPIISTGQTLVDYLLHSMAQLEVEEVRVLYLNTQNRLLADELMGRGTIDAVTIYPREIMKRALELGATAIIVAHNHPAGDPRPSKADLDSTRRLVAAGRELKVTVHDHIIITPDRFTSLRSEGLL